MVASRNGWESRRLAAPALAAALAVVYLIWQPPSLDLAAAEYRAWLFGRDGFSIWNAQWYGGHHLPGYSVLFPPLAFWLGPRALAALAVVAAAFLFERIAHARYGERAWLGSLWFAAGTATILFSGRLTFALGLVPALGALLALQRSASLARSPSMPPFRASALLAAVLAVVTALASPVAALFLALAATAYAAGERRWLGIAVAAAAMAPVAALAIAFPEGGMEPFAASSFWPVPAFAVVALLVLPREARVLRIGVVLYALGCTAAFLLDTPVGGNVVRLGALTAGPLAALVLWPQRRLALACLAPFLLWWQWVAPLRDVTVAGGDPSVHAAYYAPLLAALEREGAAGGAAGRLEIPFTRAHWETRWVAGAPAGMGGPLPLARGWERQLDVERNGLFYAPEGHRGAPITAAAYRAWLDENAVRWVAVPDVRLDYSATHETQLIARGLPYLRPVWRGAHWRLYEVRDPAPLAAAPARVLRTSTDALTLAVPGAATIRLRVRWTPYWAVVQGDACVAPDGDWTELRVREAGTIRLATRFAFGRVGARGARCSSPNVVNNGQPR